MTDTLAAANSTQRLDQRCPNCKMALQDCGAFVRWCPACDWNVDPDQRYPKRFARSEDIVDAVLRKYAGHYPRRLFEALLNLPQEKLRPRRDFNTVVSVVCACLVHGLTFCVGGGGAYLIIANWFSLLPFCFGTAFLGLAYALAPRLGKMPKDVVPHSQAPELYACVNAIACGLNAPVVDAIAVDENYSASFSMVGLRGRRVLTIGLPLWLVLDPVERTALIAHELGHGINGDPMRGFFVHGAVNSLAKWYQYLRPPALFDPRYDEFLKLAMVGINLILFGVTKCILVGIKLFAALLWHKSQEAEYLADLIGAQASGTKAFTRLLNKLAYADKLESVVLQTAKKSFKNRDLTVFDLFPDYIATLPALEKERVYRMTQHEAFRLDGTHPPTKFRQDFLEHRLQEKAPFGISEGPASFSMTDKSARQIDTELKVLEKRLSDRLIWRYCPDLA